MHRILNSAGLVLISYMVLACANIVSPGGGPRDTTPPKPLHAKPPNESVNFNAKKIIITFDEFIQLRDIYSQLMISPPLLTFPDVSIRDKSLHISFKDSLREKTTYNVFFGDAIADITEGNKLKGFRYVFSTGEYLDSMELKGNTIMAKTALPEKDLLVMLYPGSGNDSTPMKQRPLYATRASDDGSFHFKNLGTGPYKLFALKDANSNYLFDLPNELIGFQAEAVFPFYPAKKDTALIDTMPLPADPINEILLFLPEDSTQKILRAGISEYQRFSIVFKYPAKAPHVKIIKPAEQSFIQELNDGADSLHLWLTSPPADSLFAYIFDNNQLIDTIASGATYRTRRGVPGFSDLKSLPVVSNISMRTLPYFQPLILEVVRPIDEIDLNKWVLTTERDSLRDTVRISHNMVNKIGLRTMQLNFPWEEGKKYELVLLEGAIIDVYNLACDTLRFPFATTSVNDYGTMKLSVQIPQQGEHYIFELITGEKQKIRTYLISRDTIIVVNNLFPGKYRFRCIEDLNKNAKWDNGNYLLGIQPERTFFPGKETEINANWEMEIEISLDRTKTPL
jgi:uncharacterized protein (DUF2141 family)